MIGRLLLVMVMLGGSAFAAPSFEPGSCKQDVADKCVDTTPCRKYGDVTACLAGTVDPPTNAVILTETCWQYQASFTCRDSSSVDTCTPLRSKGCGQTNTQCLTYKNNDRSQGCISATLTFQCPDKPAVTRETTVCETSLCKTDGTGCFDTSHPADRDFGTAAAMAEAQREAGVYGTNGGDPEIFKGYMDECSVKTIGGSDVKSCCSAAGGGEAYSNYNTIGLTAKAAYAVGKEEMKAGSKYLYDALFTAQDASLAAEGASAAAGGLSGEVAEGVAGQAGTNFGAYGFEFSYSAAGGFEFVSFDPYSFALSVAIMIITEWLACDTQEQVVQMKRGQNLCVYIDSYCASEVLGVCVEKKERHCCFNSVLAKLINRQGRAQVGLPMNQCGGFDTEQLAMLDFSVMDLSEFIATIVPTNVDSGQLNADVKATVDKKVCDYYRC